MKQIHVPNSISLDTLWVTSCRLWLFKVQVEYVFIVSLACCQVTEKSFFKPLLLTYFFLCNSRTLEVAVI